MKDKSRGLISKYSRYSKSVIKFFYCLKELGKIRGNLFSNDFNQQIGPTCSKLRDEEPCGVGKCQDNCDDKGYECKCGNYEEKYNGGKCRFQKSISLF